MGLFGRLLKREAPAPQRVHQGLRLEEIPGAWEPDQWVPDWEVVGQWLSKNPQHKNAWRALSGRLDEQSGG